MASKQEEEKKKIKLREKDKTRPLRVHLAVRLNQPISRHERKIRSDKKMSIELDHIIDEELRFGCFPGERER